MIVDSITDKYKYTLLLCQNTNYRSLTQCRSRGVRTTLSRIKQVNGTTTIPVLSGKRDSISTKLNRSIGSKLKRQMFNLVQMLCIWNNRHQVRTKSMIESRCRVIFSETNSPPTEV